MQKQPPQTSLNPKSLLTPAAEPAVATSVPPSDEIKTTTCYMCACRCGIQVHLKDGKVRYIDGNRDHPVNRGVICGKGSAGIMQHYSPARLRAPLKRVGERGSGKFVEISWDEALKTATDWMAEVRARDPKRFALFTGRDQSQSLTGWWAMQYGTPNFAAHGGFCSVNMAAGGLYTFGGSFWEFGEPDWEHTKYFLLFGVAEDHGSNPIKIGLGKLKKRGAKVVSINPVRTGYNAIADEWLGVKPGTDGLLVGALIHELFRTNQVDLDYLVRYTNAPWLVIQDSKNKDGGSKDDGLFARDADGKPLCFDKKTNALVSSARIDIAPALVGEFTLADGRKAVPVFRLMAERYLANEYAPDTVAGEIGVPADTIRRIAAEIAEVAFKQTVTLPIKWTDWAGREHNEITGRPVAMHAMRGISAHSNGFHTCRMIHILQILLGTIDVPGGFRYKAPFPKSAPPANKPVGKPGQIKPNTPLPGMHLGFTSGPEDLLIHEDGTPTRIDKAYSWDAPLSAHGLMHMAITNAGEADPYPIDVMFLYMANMAWNSSMNIAATLDYLTAKNADGSYKIGKIIYSDAYASEMVAYADLILPDTTYLERYDCISFIGPSDLRSRRPGRRDQTPSRRTRSQCPWLPGRLDRAWRAPETPWLYECRRNAEIPRRLSRLHRQPRACAGHRPARRLARQGRDQVRRRRGQSQTARHLHRERRISPASSAARAALYEARQQILSGVGEISRICRQHRADHLPALFRSAAEIPPRRAWTRHHSAARLAQEPHRAFLRSAAFLVRAFRRHDGRRTRVPDARHHAAPDGDVSFVGLAERVAAPDSRRQPALSWRDRAGSNSASPTTIGCGSRPRSAASNARCA